MRFVQCSRDFWLSKNFSLSSFYPKWYASLYVNYNPHSVEHLFVHVERKRDRRNERKAIPFSISLRIVSSKFILKFMPCQLGETLWGEPNTLLEILLTVGRSTRTRHTTFVLVDKDENGKQTDLKSAIKLWSLILSICWNEACGAIKLLSIIYSARFSSTHTFWITPLLFAERVLFALCGTGNEIEYGKLGNDWRNQVIRKESVFVWFHIFRVKFNRKHFFSVEKTCRLPNSSEGPFKIFASEQKR